MSPGCVGCHPNSSRVSALEAGLSAARKPASHVKCSAASSGATETTGTSRMPADHLGDGADRHALVGDRVQRRSRRRRLQREAEQARGIEPVHGGPAVGPVADVAGDALVAGDVDQRRDEAGVSVTVHRRRQSHDRRADAARREGERQLGRGRASRGPRRQCGARVGAVPVPFGRHPPRCEPECPGGDDERSIRTRQRSPKRLDGAAVRVGSALEVARESEVVLEREVDHAIRRGRRALQAVEVVERAALHLGPGGGERRGRGIRAGEPDDLMARADELGNDGGADPAGRAGDEYTHEKTSSMDADSDVSCCHHRSTRMSVAVITTRIAACRVGSRTAGAGSKRPPSPSTASAGSRTPPLPRSPQRAG